MKNLFLLSILLVTSATVLAQNTTLWQASIGSGSYDQGRAVIETYDQNLIVVGSTSSWGNGNSDVYMLKVDNDGNLLWSTTYGGGNIDWGYDVVQTADSGYMIAGYTNSFGTGDYDIYVVRTDSIGNQLWDSTYGGPDWDFAYGIAATTDGHYVIAGESFNNGAGMNDAYALKIDDNGTVIWETSFGGTQGDVFHGVDTAMGGGYIFVGSTESAGSGQKDAWLLRTDDAGVVQWETLFGGPLDEAANAVTTHPSGDYLVAGYNESAFNSPNPWSIRHDADNNGTLWQNIPSNPADDILRGITYSDVDYGRVAVVGNTLSYGNGPPGDMLGYLYVDLTGVFVCSQSIGASEEEDMYGLVATTDSGFVSVGNTKSFGSNYSSIFLVKYNRTCVTVFDVDTVLDPNLIGENELLAPEALVLGNPVAGDIQVQLDVEWFAGADVSYGLYSVNGQQVASGNIGDVKVVLPRNGLAAGVYTLRISNTDGLATHLRLLLK